MSETPKMRFDVDDAELRSWGAEGSYSQGWRGMARELLAYRTRYGDIDAPPRTLFEMHNEDATPGPTLKAEDFIEAGRQILASMQPDAPPKSPQPVAGDCTWLGDCEPSDLAPLLTDIAALRAEVERRDEIIACEVGLRKSAQADANCSDYELEKAQAEAAARTVEANSLRGRTLNAESEAATAKTEAARYRAAIVECITRACNEATMLRVLALPLLTAEDRGVEF